MPAQAGWNEEDEEDMDSYDDDYDDAASDIASISEVEDAEVSQPVCRLFQQSVALRKVAYWECYINAMGNSLSDMDFISKAFAFLLTLLTNVKTLHLPLLRWPDPLAEELIERLEVSAELAAITHPGLGKLQTLTSPTMETMLAHSAPNLWAMLALPRVQDVELSMQYVPRKLKLALPLSTVLRSISLQRCYLKVDDITALVQNTPSLQAFYYSHFSYTSASHIYHTPINVQWDVCALFNSIGVLAGDRLQHLSIAILSCEQTITGGLLEMNKFTKLTHLNLPISALRFDWEKRGFTQQSSALCSGYAGLTIPSSVKILSFSWAHMCHNDNPYDEAYVDPMLAIVKGLSIERRNVWSKLSMLGLPECLRRQHSLTASMKKALRPLKHWQVAKSFYSGHPHTTWKLQSA